MGPSTKGLTPKSHQLREKHLSGALLQLFIVKKGYQKYSVVLVPSSNLEPNRCGVYRKLESLGFSRKNIISGYCILGKFRSVLDLATFV